MFEYGIIILLGLILGSFLNVCIARLPEDKSIVTPGSHCFECKKSLYWYDNIPVVSYFILRGKCRFCKKGISLVYPAVEIITALIFVFLYHRFSYSPELLKYATFFFLLIVVSFIDIKYHAIPAYLCILGMALAVLFSLFPTFDMVMNQNIFTLQALPVYDTFAGMLFGLGFAYFFKIFGDLFLALYLRLRKKESIEGETESLGLGDVDFMGLVGAFLGIQSVVLVFFLAPFVAILYLPVMLIFKKSHLLPYLPYLSIATFIAFVWGSDILNLILF